MATFPANTASGTYLQAQDNYISLITKENNIQSQVEVNKTNQQVHIFSEDTSSNNTYSSVNVDGGETSVYISARDYANNTKSSVDTKRDAVYIDSQDENANTRASVSLNQGEYKNVYIQSEDKNANTKSTLSVDGAGTYKEVSLRSEDKNANTKSSISVNGNRNKDVYLASRDYANNTKSSMSACSTRYKNIYIQSRDDNANTYSSIDVKDNAGEGKKYVYLQAVNKDTNTRSQLNITDKDKNVYLAARDDNANSRAQVWISNANSAPNTRSAFGVNNDSSKAESYLYTRDDRPGANTRAIMGVSRKYSGGGTWISEHDGTQEWANSWPDHILTTSIIYANNAAGVSYLRSQNFVEDVDVRVATNHIDKDILLSVDADGSTNTIKVSNTAVTMNAEDTSATTISSLEVSNEKQNIYMVAKDDTDGSRTTINVNNRDDNKRIFLTARNDTTGTRSVIEISDKEEHVYLETSDASVKSLIAVSRKHKNIDLFVESEKSATSLQVTDEQVTINGSRVLTQADLDQLRAPRPRSIFGWFTGR